MIRAYEAATGRLSSQQQRADGASFNSFDYSYTERGNVIAKREAVGTPLEREMTYAYEPVFNKLISITHYSGFETTYTYDGFGNILAETDPRGGVQSFSYDSAGLPLTSTDKNGNVTTTFYSLEGRLERMTDPSGTVTTCSSAAPLYQQRQCRRAAPVFISDFVSFS